MLIEKIAIFIIFLGPLIFFHELGHFLFARFFGVKVEVFSIGFGPKLFKKKIGDTEYAISIIPLGGYVKMFGDDPFNKDEIAEIDRKYSFTHQNKFARFWIIMGGPLANFILAFVIFFALMISGERIPEIKIGSLPTGSILYENGLRTGDVLVRVNGNDVYNPSDLMVEGNSTVSSLTIKRNEEIKELAVNLAGNRFFDEVVQYPPFLRKPYLVDQMGNKFALSLLRENVDLKLSIEELANLNTIKTFYLHSLDKGHDLAKDEVEVKKENGAVKEINVSFSDVKSLFIALESQGLRPLDLMVKNVTMNSPADKAGIKGNDIFVSIEGEKVFTFQELRSKLQTFEKSPVVVEIFSQGVLKKINISPEVTMLEGKSVKLLGVESTVEILKTNFVLTKSKGVVSAVTTALVRTWDSMKKTVDGFVKLISNQISLKAIGGPLAIGQVAHDSFNTSLSYFFQLMALISVNLGVINLFPIPVLDGGHIMFIVLETLNGGPLSRRKMEIAQQVGLSLLLILMAGAIFNDVSRFF